MATEQTENYLKQIYSIQEEGGKVSTSSLSRRLQISAASVTEMIKKMAEEGYLDHTPYKGVELTTKGRLLALQIVRRHRLWELFLNDVLKLDWEYVHEEAERLEHVMSERIEKRMEEILGYPEQDPHGHAIPTPKGQIPARKDIALTETVIGQSLLVSRINDLDTEILKHAKSLGIKPRKIIRIKGRIAVDGSMKIEIGGKEQFISEMIARNIFVCKRKNRKS